MKEKFVLSIKIEKDNYSNQIILDKFDCFGEIYDWSNWLKEIYNKVKEKR